MFDDDVNDERRGDPAGLNPALSESNAPPSLPNAESGCNPTGRTAAGDVPTAAVPFCLFDQAHAPLVLDDGPSDVGVCFKCRRVWTPAGPPGCPHCASLATGRTSLLCRPCDMWVSLSAWTAHSRDETHRSCVQLWGSSAGVTRLSEA